MFGRVGKGSAPAAQEGTALRASSLHPRLFMLVALLHLCIRGFWSRLVLSFKLDMTVSDIPTLASLTPGDFPSGYGLSCFAQSQQAVSARPLRGSGFMSKMTSKRDHETSHSLAREVYASNILDSSLPRLDGFERCGESFDTIISANPVSYPGSAEALKKARTEAERFTKAVFDRIEYIRGASK